MFFSLFPARSTNVKAPSYSLLNQAWAFQERLLSARILHFTTNELMWECREMQTCECTTIDYGDQAQLGDSIKWKFPVPDSLEQGEPPFNGSGINPQLKLQEPPTACSDIVEAFSELSLTFHKDRLPALSGIAKSMNSFGLGKYYAGLWEREFPFSLCWFARQPATPRNYTSCPSWSWASVAGSISASFWSFSKPFVTIHDVKCSLAGDHPYGKVLSGRLSISGNLIAVKVVEAYAWHEGNRVSQIEMEGESFPCYWDENGMHRFMAGYDIFCMDMGYARLNLDECVKFLVLRCMNQDSQTYTRVGVAMDSSWRPFQYGDGGNSRFKRITIV